MTSEVGLPESLKATLERQRDTSRVFKDVLQDHSNLLAKLREYEVRCSQLEKITLEFQSENESLSEQLEQASQPLKDEILRLYQENERVLKERDGLLDQLEVLRDTISRQIVEIQNVVGKRDDLQETVSLLRTQLAHMQEAQSLSAREMTDRIKQLEQGEKKIRDAEEENRDLVARIIHLKDQEAARMNEMNSIRDKIIKDAKVQAEEILRNATLKASANDPDVSGLIGSLSLHSAALEEDVKPKKVKSASKHAHIGGCTSICFDKSGEIMASSGLDKVVRLWNTDTCKQSAVLRGAHETVNDVSVTADGKYILGAEDFKAIRLWDVNTSRMINMSLTGHTGKVTGVEAFPSDPLQAASCGSDRCIKFWNLDRGICSKTIPFTSTAKRLKVLDDHGVAASAHFDGRLRIWDKRATSVAHEVDAHAGKDICGIDYLSQSSLICTVGRNNSIVMIDTRTFSVLGQCTHPQFSADVLCQPSISPSGRFVSGGCKDGSFFIWRIDLEKRSSRVESILKRHDASVMVTSWNQSSTHAVFVSADRNGTLLFWT